MNYNYRSRFLSERMSRTVLATRGNSGVGKSSLVQRSIQKQLLPDALELYVQQTEQFLQGVMNPDHIKATLKAIDDQFLLNSQVHLEGRMIFELMLNQRNSTVNGAIIDTRLLELEDFEKIVRYAQKSGASLKILDVDAPIWFSILSVLERAPFGQHPCVTFEVIKEGFIASRTNRAQFIDAAIKMKASYTLYHLDATGKYVKALRKRQDQDIIEKMATSLVLEGLQQTPVAAEIEQIGHTIITDTFIQALDVPKDKSVLLQWRGYTVIEALKVHSEGKKPCPF